MPEVITDNLGLWTSALLTKSTAGRGSNGKLEAYGIKKLRELILELAITGRLLGNDTNGWTETLLGEIGEWGSGGTPLKTHPEYYGGDIPWLVIGDLNDGLVIEAQTYITQLGLEKSSAHLVPEGTLLIAMYGSIGKLGIAGIPCATNQAIAFCNPESKKIETQYLFIYLRAIRAHLLSRGQGLAQQNISQKILKATSIKLPSLEEQLRIVAKVDELMALCDQLEQQQTHSIEAHQTLVASLLGTLTRVESQQEFSEAWTRIASHFDTLFTTEASIDHLKQTILQLAVMGKLVTQDPREEAASTLLKKISGKKEELVREGKLKKQTPLPEIGDDEKLFGLPAGWVWARLQDVIDVRDGTHDSPKDAFGADTYPLVTSKNFVDGEIDFDSARRISATDHFEIAKRSAVEKFDILFSMIGGNLGNQVMVKDERQFSVKNVALFKYYSKELTSPFYIKKYMEHLALDLQERAIGGAQPFVSLGFLRSLIVALPPIEEQHRIVAKVDELMALCDALKARLADAQTTQLHLADAIVEQAVA